MSWGTPDPYYQPEEFNATIVGEVQWDEPCYSFDLTVVWKDEDGMYRMDSDSGCSCPTPFEDTKWEELERLSAIEVAEALNKRLEQEAAYPYGDHGAYASGQVIDLLSRLVN